jgi:hypothetical protein
VLVLVVVIVVMLVVVLVLVVMLVVVIGHRAASLAPRDGRSSDLSGCREVDRGDEPPIRPEQPKRGRIDPGREVL